MSAVILDGKALGLRIEAHLAERVAALKNSGIAVSYTHLRAHET